MKNSLGDLLVSQGFGMQICNYGTFSDCLNMSAHIIICGGQMPLQSIESGHLDLVMVFEDKFSNSPSLVRLASITDEALVDNRGKDLHFSL